jgi:hypothetical protein
MFSISVGTNHKFTRPTLLVVTSAARSLSILFENFERVVFQSQLNTLIVVFATSILVEMRLESCLTGEPAGNRWHRAGEIF